MIHSCTDIEQQPQGMGTLGHILYSVTILDDRVWFGDFPVDGGHTRFECISLQS